MNMTVPPTLTLPLKGGGDLSGGHSSFPLPLDGGGRGGGDSMRAIDG